MTHAWLVRYKNKFGQVEEYGLLASCRNECKQWVKTLNGCTFLSATLILRAK